MAGKKQKAHNSKKPPRNWVARQMIIERTGQSQFMRDRRDRRALEHGKDWEKEDWGDSP